MGLLHIEIVKERLEREFNLSLIATSPNVIYQVKFTPRKTHPQELLALADAGNGYKWIDNPANFPPYGDIIDIKEPTIKIKIVVPIAYMDGVMTLLKEKRGQYISLENLSSERVVINYYMPMAEMVVDFYNKLKSVSKGYASFDYEIAEYQSSDVVLMEILIHGSPVDALSVITHKDKAVSRGRLLCEKLKELIGRQQFEVALQARVNGKIVARETIPAYRKDVIAKCYGGDITRKRKLLEKQKEGKKRMKSIGNVDIPQEAFIAMLKIEE
jgi:GTP-binding protein LepA